jgi:hypothetical protein
MQVSMKLRLLSLVAALILAGNVIVTSWNLVGSTGVLPALLNTDWSFGGASVLTAEA